MTWYSCERFNRHLPESDYAIDLSRVPGQTPTRTPTRSRPLSPIATNNPSATPSVPRTPAHAPTLDINNTKIAITTPAFLAGSKTVGAKAYSAFNAFAAPNLPSTDEDKENVMPNDSPATPYFLHPGEIVQKTCPPKASAYGTSGNGGRAMGNVFLIDDANTPLKHRLMLAKRKSLEWSRAPKVASPLRNSIGAAGESL